MTALLLALLFTCRVSDISPANRSLSVSCQLPASERVRVKFRESFAGIDKLYDRVTSPRIRDGSGRQITLELRGNGAYSFSAQGFSGPIEITWTVRFNRPLEPSQYPLVSGLGPESGHLYPFDLIPEFTTEENEPYKLENLRIDPPSGWSVKTIENSTFVLGKITESPHTAITGAWSFSDDYFSKLVGSIATTQASMLEAKQDENYLVSLAPFPYPLTGLRSAALARERTVVLMLNQGPDAARTRAQLERHVAHEMFHYYLPNSFRARDNFDWFWEGFSRYAGLLTLLEMKSLTFEQFLELLLAEYDAYRVNPARNEISLVTASPEKFASSANYEIVYRKGLLAAALYDLELRWQSRGSKRLIKVILGIYRDYALKNREIGNREVIEALKSAGDIASQVSDDIEGIKEIDLIVRLEKFGISLDRRVSQGAPKLVVKENLSGRQKELIDQFW